MNVLPINTSLGSALSQSVLAIQQTQREIDLIQTRIATGRSVNTVFDNPFNFFFSQALGSRAAKLDSLLDNIAKNATVINQASETLESLQSLIEEQQTILTDALTEINTNNAQARLTGNTNLTNISDLVGALGGVDNNDRLVFSFVDTDGSINSGNTVAISTNDSTDDLLAAINAIQDTGSNQVFNAQLDANGQLDIRTQDGSRFEIEFHDNGGNANLQLAASLGFGGFTLSEIDDGTSVARITAFPQPSLVTIPLYEENGGAGGTIATASTTLIDLTDSATGLTGDIINGDANDALNISVDGGTAVEVIADLSTATLQDLLDGINDNASLNTKIKATYDSSNGVLNIRAIDDSVSSIQLELEEDAAGAGTAGKIDLQKLGFGTRILQSGADGSGNISSESIQLNAAVSTLVGLEQEFNEIRSQIDELVNDADVEGINLLKGDSVLTYFNEAKTSSLNIVGDTFTSTSLGVSEGNFGTASSVNASINEIEDALTSVENFSSRLSTNKAIIEIRESFTSNTIGTLEGGIEDLVGIDTTEETARLSKLQARQILAVTALSLATQNKQSILRGI